MYTEKERAKLLIQAATVVSTYPEVEGIVQVGSGVEGFLDEYSDIDLIFSTFTSQQVPVLRARMDKLFSDALRGKYEKKNAMAGHSSCSRYDRIFSCWYI